MARRLPLQATIYEDAPPVRPGNPLFCHQEFLEKMEEHRSGTVGRRASLLLQRLLVNLSRQFYKPTQGENRGWRRSPLGGGHGSHFYAWWAPRGAAPLKDEEFDAAPEGSIFLRDIRHHDDHRPLNPQSLADHYLPIGPAELHQHDYVPDPWTKDQAKFTGARQKVRILKGFPGSGKTTALLHAAEMAGRQSILYVTFSPELTVLARDHFDKLAPGNKRFHVATYSQFVRQILGSDAPFQTVAQSRRAFVKEVSGFSSTILGPWLNEKGALYDEIHAHIFGGLLPVPVGRFAGFPDRRITARQYRDLRERSIGRHAAEAVIEIVDTIRRRDPGGLERRFFSELDLAWNAARRIRAEGAGPFANVDCIAIDEAQDLTPIEALAIIDVAVALGGNTSLLVAGDEAQTVRPTDFEWGWFQDLIHFRLASPMEFKLPVNLRSPKRIASLVNRVYTLYAAISKHERPGGGGIAEIDDNAGDQIIFCAAKSGPELDELLEAFTQREGLAVIALGEELPAYLPEALKDRVLTTFEAKGLDFQSVCVLDAGKWVDRIFHDYELGRASELEDFTKRLAIDQLRVALSPAERLYWLDVNPGERVVHRAQEILASAGERAFPVVPAVLRKTLEEESLDPEERVRLCEVDARQFLDIKPALAWSRARQAVALLGEPGSKFSVTDRAARQSAHLTLAQVAFTLAFRKVNMPAEMGRIDLYMEAQMAAAAAGRSALGSWFQLAARYQHAPEAESAAALANMTHRLVEIQKEIEPWLVQELQPHSAKWLEVLEERLQHVPVLAEKTLPGLYALFAPVEAEERMARLRVKSIRALMRMREFREAYAILQAQPEPDLKLIAECREGMGQLEAAAADYLKAGLPEDALRCYRSIPDLDQALELLQSMGEHPARESLAWVRRLRELTAQRPAAFAKVMLPAEKKLLEELLESGLGVVRKKPAPRKAAATKKSAASKGTLPVPKAPAAKRAAASKNASAEKKVGNPRPRGNNPYF